MLTVHEASCEFNALFSSVTSIAIQSLMPCNNLV